MKRIKNFVKNTFKNLPKDERNDVIESVTEKLVEKVEDLVEKGLTIDEAIDKTVTEFGTVEDYFEETKKEKRFKRFKSIAHYRNDLFFSLGGSLIIIAIMVFINLSLTGGDILWFVIPSIALLWWPLVVGYRLLNKVETNKGEKDE